MIFSNKESWGVLVIALAILLPLAWGSWRAVSRSQVRSRYLALAFRGAGILLVVFAIADPQTVGERPVKGANIVALLADNSAGLQIKDDGSPLTRGETVRQALTGDAATWVSELKDDFQVRSYVFDKQVRRTNGFESLSFDGQRSEISNSLAELANRLDGMPVSGIVLFTDGNTTDGFLSEEQRALLPPVYPIVVGEPNAVPDLSIQSFKVSQSAFGDTPLSLTTRIQQSSPSKQTTRTQLRQIGADALQGTRIIEEKIGLLDADDALSFEWKAPGGGIQFFEIRTEGTDPTVPEATLANNSRLFSVDRGKKKNRILYVTGRPNWEYKFLNRALSADPQLDIVGLIRVASREPNFEFKGRAGENSNSLYRGFGREDETERYDQSVLIRMNTRDENELKTGFPNEAEELFSYDAIVIDDLEAGFFSFSQQTLIRDFVKQRGGGLLMLGGVNSLEDGGYENTPIAQTLPVHLDGLGPSASAGRLVQWDLSRSGWVEPWMRIRSFETDERERIQNMPWLRVYNTLQRIKPGAEVLATLEDSAAESYPALVTRKFGSGRVATLAVGDLWRWGMQNPGTQSDLAQFWRQISRWLVTDNPSLVTLSVGETTGSSVLLTAQARDTDYHPLQAGTADITVRKMDSKESDRNYTMQVASGHPGQFEIELPLKEEGAFLATAIVRSADGLVLGEAETGWVHQPLVEEFASLTPNRTYLEQLAESTGGAVLQLSELDRLGSALEAQTAPMMETWTKPLWHTNWLFLLALSSFLAEWLLRRKRGLA